MNDWHLWLDMDNTLVCAMPGFYPMLAPDSILGPSGRDAASRHADFQTLYIYKRPGLDDFLSTFDARPDVHVHLWTAGSRRYAHAVLDQIGLRDRFERILGYEDCSLHPTASGKERVHKDLRERLAEGVPPERIIFVDDRSQYVLAHGAWVIEISGFTGDPDDSALALVQRMVLAHIDHQRPREDPEIQRWIQSFADQDTRNWFRARGWTWIYDPDGSRWPGTWDQG